MPYKYAENTHSRPISERKGVVKLKQKDTAQSKDDWVANRNRREFLGRTLSFMGALAAMPIAKGIPLPNIGGGRANVSSGVEIRQAKGSSGVEIKPIVGAVAGSAVEKDTPAAKEKIFEAAYQFSRADELQVEIEAAKQRMGKFDELGNLDETIAKRVLTIEQKWGRYFEGLSVEVRDLVYGLIIQESEGIADNKSVDESTGEVIAMGLTAMTKLMAHAHNIEVTDGPDDGRGDPDIILPETVKELNKAYRYWGDWGMAIWEWHSGLPNLNDFVKLYISDNFGDTAAVPESFPIKLKEYELDAHRLLSYGKLKDMIKSNPRMDKSEEYLYNVVAASVAFGDHKRSAQKQ